MIIVGVLVSLAAGVIIVTITVSTVKTVIVLRRRKGRTFSSDFTNDHVELSTDKATIGSNNLGTAVVSSESTMEKLKYQDFKVTVFHVQKDCELREFIENECNLKFERGCAFYEFTHDVEKISENQEVVQVKQVSSACMI